MSKFLTPPVWYDSNGNLVEILTGGATLPPGTIYTNSMAIGKDSSLAGSYAIAIGDHTNAYADNTIAIGDGASSYAPGCIAIGARATVAPGEGTIGSIAIGKGSHVCGNGSIAIGEGITLGTDGNPLNYTIQIGAPDQTYSAQIGNGNGILKCICSKAQTTSFTNTEWIQSVKDSTNRPYAYLDGDVPATYQVVAFSSADSTNCMASTIIYFEGFAGGSRTEYHQTFRVDTGFTPSDTHFRHVSKAYAVHIVPTSGQSGTWTMWVAYTSPNSADLDYLGFKYRRIA